MYIFALNLVIKFFFLKFYNFFVFFFFGVLVRFEAQMLKIVI